MHPMNPFDGETGSGSYGRVILSSIVNTSKAFSRYYSRSPFHLTMHTASLYRSVWAGEEMKLPAKMP
jgi:hypothetical protein